MYKDVEWDSKTHKYLNKTEHKQNRTQVLALGTQFSFEEEF